MARSVSDIAADLDALLARDFDEADTAAEGHDRLEALCDELREVADASAIAPPIFRTMERLDNVQLGTPGPLVHTLEATAGYQPYLVESLRRKPSPLALWMVNRILNGRPENADSWLALLRTSIEHPAASPATRASATEFLKHQASWAK